MTSASALPVRPGAEPFDSDGGPVGVLLSHGFTGSPASIRPWGEFLAARGHTVRVPRLPGHGTTWQDMNRTRWDDWYGELERALTDLRSRCDRLVVGGLSMGGALALRLAERHQDIAAVMVVNPAVASSRFDVRLVPALKWVVPSMPGIGNDIKKTGADEIGYDRTPLKALGSMLTAWKQTRAELGAIRAPLLYFRSTEDHVVDEASEPLILDGVSSSVREVVRLENSYHVATIDQDAPIIFERSAAFIDEHARA